ncbi:MAG: DUF3798 domain-containing protein [Treponemataceae bacterium]|nr:DUF3798 domain-containing protein [Treponemataceae bacterium]
MKKSVKLIILCLCVLTSISLCSCKKKVDKTKWDPETGHVAILYGYGYNDPEFVQNSIAHLSDKFGLIQDGGLIVHFVFPDDFSAGGAGRISNLSYYVEENNCKALITLGAPEYTHKALARIKDAERDCFIISLFSQDDVLSTEADSDVVIDFVEPEKTVEMEVEIAEEASMQHIEKTQFILERTIKSVSGENLFKESSIQEVISKLYGQDWKVGSYVDSSTGLKAKNHFVLKYVEKQQPERKKKGKASK